jgi:hypothetical protein
MFSFFLFLSFFRSFPLFSLSHFSGRLQGLLNDSVTYLLHRFRIRLEPRKGTIASERQGTSTTTTSTAMRANLTRTKRGGVALRRGTPDRIFGKRIPRSALTAFLPRCVALRRCTSDRRVAKRRPRSPQRPLPLRLTPTWQNGGSSRRLGPQCVRLRVDNCQCVRLRVDNRQSRRKRMSEPRLVTRTHLFPRRQQQRLA